MFSLKGFFKNIIVSNLSSIIEVSSPLHKFDSSLTSYICEGFHCGRYSN